MNSSTLKHFLVNKLLSEKIITKKEKKNNEWEVCLCSFKNETYHIKNILPPDLYRSH